MQQLHVTTAGQEEQRKQQQRTLMVVSDGNNEKSTTTTIDAAAKSQPADARKVSFLPLLFYYFAFVHLTNVLVLQIVPRGGQGAFAALFQFRCTIKILCSLEYLVGYTYMKYQCV